MSHSVAFGSALSYTVGMPRQRTEDELTSREAAALLEVSLVRFYELVREGRIQKHYRGLAKRPYYSRTEMVRLLAESQSGRPGSVSEQRGTYRTDGDEEGKPQQGEP